MERIEELKAMFSREPFAKTLGATLDALAHGHAVISMTLPEHLAIASGTAQAGVMLSLGDYAGVYAAMTLLSEGHTPASDAGGYFTRPVKIGEVMRAEARVEDATRGCVAVRVDITVGDRHVSGQTWKYAKPKIR